MRKIIVTTALSMMMILSLYSAVFAHGGHQSLTQTANPTNTPSVTLTPTNTPGNTESPTPTSTPSQPGETGGPSSTPSQPVPTSTPQVTDTPTPTSTPTVTLTPSPVTTPRITLPPSDTVDTTTPQSPDNVIFYLLFGAIIGLIISRIWNRFNENRLSKRSIGDRV